MSALDYLCHKETCQEIIRAMTGQQLFLAWLRWNGHTAVEIANMLGVSERGLLEHLNDAKRRICSEVPGATAVLGDVGPAHRCVFCGEYVSRGSQRCYSCAGKLRMAGETRIIDNAALTSKTVV